MWNSKRHSTIRFKISLGLLVMGFIASVTISVSALYAFYDRSISEGRKHLESVANLQRQRVRSFMGKNLEWAQFIANRPQLQSWSDQLQQTDQLIYQEKLNEMLLKELAAIPDMVRIDLLDEFHLVVASTDERDLYEHFQSSVIDWESTEQALRLTQDEQLLIITTVPLQSHNGTRTLLQTTASAAALSDITQDYIGLGDTGETVLAQQWELADRIDFLTPLRFDSKAHLLRSLNVSDTHLPIVQAIQGVESFFQNLRDYRDVEVFSVTLSMPANRMGLVVKIDQAELLGSFYRLQTILFQLIVGFFAVGLLVAYLISRSISRPIEYLTKIAKSIHQGEHQVRVDYSAVNYDSETYLLAQTLNDVTNELVQTFDAAPNGMLVVKSDGKIMRANRELNTIFGYEPGSLKGQALEVLLPQAQRERHAQHRADYLQEPSPRPMGGDMELQGCRQDGTCFPVEVGLSTINNKNERLVLATVVDVTERKRLNEAHIRAREEAEKATQAKSEFLANMSHEIRTPMNAITGFTYLALQEKLSPKVRDQIRKVDLSARSLLKIINDILDFSKIEAGKLILEQTPFFLDDVMENVVNLGSSLSREKDIEILLLKEGAVPSSLIGDPIRLGQILTNLMYNAIKFTEEGSVMIRVELVELDEAGQVTLNFVVEDTGIGMEAATIENLFRPFVQADGSTTRQYGGTGLGLSIVKQLSTMMKGEVAVESEVGQGSRFRVTLPFGVGEETVDVRYNLKYRFEQLKVLIVDDNPVSQDVARQAIDLFGSASVVVSTGEEAIEQIKHSLNQQSPFDFVLCDWRLPGMDGVLVSREIQQLYREEEKRPVIILVTAYERELLLEQYDVSEIEAVLIKPVTSSSLYDTMIQFIHPDLEADAPVDPGTRPDYLKGIQLLLVEDNELNQEVAISMLESVGAEVVIASNGVEALEKMEQLGHALHMVLMDIQMPGMDGLEATRQIRQRAEWSEISVVALTANASQQDREQCLSAGMDDYLSKPVDPSRVYQVIRRWAGDGQENVDFVKALAEQVVQVPADDQATSVVDLDVLLSRLQNDPNRVVRLMDQFLLDASSKIISSGTALQEKRFEDARKEIHGLVGTSGNLTANQLFQAAHHLEMLLKEGSDEEEISVDLLTPLENALERLQQEWSEGREKLLREGKILNESAMVAGRSQEEISVLIEALRSALKGADFDAAEKVEQLIEALGEGGEARLVAVKRAIHHFEYGKALSEFEKLEL